MQVQQFPLVCLKDVVDELISEDVLVSRFNDKGDMELLICWVGKLEVEDSWMSTREFVECFPTLKLEGNLGSMDNVLIDTIRLMFGRREKEWKSIVKVTWQEMLELSI